MRDNSTKPSTKPEPENRREFGLSLPRFSVQNPVLVNLILVATITTGGVSALTLVREMFPESRPSQVNISTFYPGATPVEVEKGISIKIEERIKTLEDLDEMRTNIGEGSSTITLSLTNGVEDIDQVVTDTKALIDTIPREDFPEDAEETRVVASEPRLPVISLSLFGDIDEETLKKWGKRIRDDLLAIEGITEVTLLGTRPDEIIVEIRPDRLVEYGLSFTEVSDAVSRSNLDLPAGQVRTRDGNVAVRTMGEKDRGQAISQIIIRSDSDGRVVRLSDVAHVMDGFADVDVIGRFNAKPAVSMTVYKTGDQDAIEIASKIKAFVAGKTGQPFALSTFEGLMPKGRSAMQVYEEAKQQPYANLPGNIMYHGNLARFIEGRLDLLKRNGLWGLLFVFITLLLFLNWRVAFWVMMGLVISIFGTLVCMKIAGVTLNLVTMFGMIIVMGMLVDDGIIVAEHIYTKIEGGMRPSLAAIQGAEEVTWPVVCAIATTIAAFAPLIFVEGMIGDFFGVLPLIVIFALSFSLFEALTILPSHLSHHKLRSAKVATDSRWQRLRGWQKTMLEERLAGRYEQFLRLAVANRYVTLAAVVAGLVLVAGMIGGGRVPFEFIQKMDSETLIANLEMPIGTPIEQTNEAISLVEGAAEQVSEVKGMYTLVGSQVDQQGALSGSRSHMAQVIFELTKIELRERNSEQILAELRERTGDIPGVDSLRFRTIHGGPGGVAIQVEISGTEISDIVAVADRFKERLDQFDGVFDIADNFDAGQREVQIELLESARALGLTTQELATQVRAAFLGLEARKINRDREDVKIMVRYPEEYRRHVYDVESMWVATPSGKMVPFSEVARVREARSYASINRLDQKRTVTVTADIDEALTNTQLITGQLASEFSELRGEHNVTLKFGGRRREMAISMGSLNWDFMAAMMFVYVILAGLFRSYIQPLVVMTAIPFGLIGAVLGHYVMGYPMTILSVIGLVALSGIVVNDSLILVTFINRRLAEGLPMVEAVIGGGRSRLRPILLTSITTISGLAPLMAEQSFQAKFLIPMGISITYGLAFSTVLILIVVPCIYLIFADLQSVVTNAVGKLVPQLATKQQKYAANECSSRQGRTRVSLRRSMRSLLMGKTQKKIGRPMSGRRKNYSVKM